MIAYIFEGLALVTCVAISYQFTCYLEYARARAGQKVEAPAGEPCPTA